jgi:hypothetical protein
VVLSTERTGPRPVRGRLGARNRRGEARAPVRGRGPLGGAGGGEPRAARPSRRRRPATAVVRGRRAADAQADPEIDQGRFHPDLPAVFRPRALQRRPLRPFDHDLGRIPHRAEPDRFHRRVVSARAPLRVHGRRRRSRQGRVLSGAAGPRDRRLRRGRRQALQRGYSRHRLRLPAGPRGPAIRERPQARAYAPACAGVLQGRLAQGDRGGGLVRIRGSRDRGRGRSRCARGRGV